MEFPDLQQEKAKLVDLFSYEEEIFAEDVSVIASPYRDMEGRVVGVLGVIGPTRLNYARVVPMVDLTARSLGQSLSRAMGKPIT